MNKTKVDYYVCNVVGIMVIILEQLNSHKYTGLVGLNSRLSILDHHKVATICSPFSATAIQSTL